VAGLSPTAVWPVSPDGPPFGAAPLTVTADRRKFRVGDDGELADGSGISHANAAGETDDESDDDRPGGTVPEEAGAGDPSPEGPEPDDLTPEGAALEGPAAVGSPPGGLAGSGPFQSGEAGAEDETGAEGRGPRFRVGESSTALAAIAFPWPGSDPFGRVPRAEPMLSAGSAGTPSTMVSSIAVGPPLAEESFLLAGAPFAETPLPAGPSATASSGSASAEAGPAVAGLDDGSLGGAMTLLGRVSRSSPMRSSSVALEVTTVGVPLPEPSGLSVPLSKPSSH
jgi:hypothetical protein